MKRFALLGLSVGLFACKSEEAKQCLAQYETAQIVVTKREASAESLQRTLASLQKAIDACTKAGRRGEVEQLLGARNIVRADLKQVQDRKGRRKRKRLTPEQLQQYAKSGDPSCPKGQGYKHAGKEIRCKGPQIISMSRSQATRYLDDRGYKLNASRSNVTAEYGAEKLVLTFPAAPATAPPDCITLYPPPGMSWQEAVARITGARPDRLDAQRPAPTPRGPLPLKLETGPQKLIVHLGSCGG